MGADGHIDIWEDSKVRAVFGDKTDELFGCLPSHYCHELDGKKYHHCYWGDNIYAEYTLPGTWYIFDDTKVTKKDIEKFVEWLEENKTHWEVFDLTAPKKEYMQLNIKLKNPKYCDGCPCHYRDGSEDSEKTIIGCTMNYYIARTRKRPIESNFGVNRPKKCIEEQGE